VDSFISGADFGTTLKSISKDIPDGLGFGLVDDQLFVLGFVAQRHGAAGPFALAS
jgi:hypothetical protein